MWNDHRMPYWEIFTDSARTEPGYIFRRFFVDNFEVYDDSGKATTFYTLGESWKAETGHVILFQGRELYEKGTMRVETLIFDSREEARSFMKLLIEVLSTRGENEICTMLSRYVCEKALHSKPEEIIRLREEQKAYEKALAEKRAREREAEKALARMKKRNHKNLPAHVYIFSFGERFCKIGISHNVEDRRKTKVSETGRMTLQWCYTNLFPRGIAEEIEHNCHVHFKENRTFGEFFNITFDEACVYLQSQVAEPLIQCKGELK